MRYIYEIRIVEDDGSYSMEVPDLPGCLAWGDSVAEVLESAPDALETHVGAYLADGEPVPSATFGHGVGDGEVLAVVSFDATPASVGAPCVMASTAAARLGVSPARVSHLLRDGVLDGYRSGRETLVTLASIERYEATPRRPGRPRKTAVVS
jgi:predicted RNase H-like HicB family nuclease